MKKKLSTTEQLQYSTFRIEGEDKHGNGITGTGFFFNILEEREDKKQFLVMITNKHVVENMEKGRIHFTLADSDGNPMDTSHQIIETHNFKNYWKPHPDPNVDLCASPLNINISILFGIGKVPFLIPIDRKFIPSKEELDQLNAIEDLTMIGYPNGIWDKVNNQPIIRRGITATHPNKDYMGEKKFIADIATFPGSSGSPVFIFNESSYTTKDNNIHIGKSRLYLMGVVHAVFMHTSAGEITTHAIPANNKYISIHQTPNNLGIVIKSEMLLDFEDVFKKELKTILE